jgi:hypothetical protein
MISDMSTWEFISDSPIDRILPYMLPLYSNIITINTFRESDMWVVRRLEDHWSGPMCKSHLWKHESVLHPFDILSCLKQSKYAFQSITKILGKPKINSVPVLNLKSAYIKMNTVNMMVILMRHMRMSEIIERSKRGLILSQKEQRQFNILPICLWDNPVNVSSSKETHKVINFLSNW